MNIRQLSVNYMAEQDRILLRANTAASEEMRLWLTRRLMVQLWPLLNDLATRQLLQFEAAGSSLESADAGLKKMLTDFRKEQFLREADFGTPYEEKSAVMPLGPEPLLVTEVDASALPDGEVRLQFHERSPSDTQRQRNFQMQMQPKLMQGLMHLLGQALQRSQWSEAFATSAAADASLIDALEPSAGKPRYLN